MADDTKDDDKNAANDTKDENAKKEAAKEQIRAKSAFARFVPAGSPIFQAIRNTIESAVSFLGMGEPIAATIDLKDAEEEQKRQDALRNSLSKEALKQVEAQFSSRDDKSIISSLIATLDKAKETEEKIAQEEKLIQKTKARVKEKYAETDDLFEKTKSENMEVAGNAVKAMLEESKPEKIDSLAQDVVEISQRRKTQLEGRREIKESLEESLKKFEESKTKNGGKLDKKLKPLYEDLQARVKEEEKKFVALEETVKEEVKEFTDNIGKKLFAQAASDLAKEMEKEGLITKETDEDKQHNNTVLVMRIMEKDEAVKEAVTQGSEDVAKATLEDPNNKNACSEALEKAKGSIIGVVDITELSQKVNQAKIQAEKVQDNSQAASNHLLNSMESKESAQAPAAASPTTNPEPQKEGEKKAAVEATQAPFTEVAELTTNNPIAPKAATPNGGSKKEEQKQERPEIKAGQPSTTELPGSKSQQLAQEKPAAGEAGLSNEEKRRQRIEQTKKLKQEAKSPDIIKSLRESKATNLAPSSSSDQKEKPLFVNTIDSGKNPGGIGK